ncbi:MAG: hypothetical protein LRY54_00805 [Alphaproteobacteria bacterium]|nr:hypothetical protein [Alphaproteobacteria bacterium]
MAASVKDTLLFTPSHRSYWLAEIARRMFAEAREVSEPKLNDILDRPREEFNGLSLVQAARQSVDNFHYAEDILGIEIG